MKYYKEAYYEMDNFIWIRIPKNGTFTFLDLLNLDKESGKRKEDINWNNKYVFTFVRNLYDRLVSCWKNRIMEIKKMETNPELLGLNFYDFVNKVCKIPDEIADEHFRSQYWFVKDINVDFIGSIENIENDWYQLSKILNLNKNLVHHKKSSRKNYKYYYNNDLYKKVYQRYINDFEKFGYKKELKI